MIPDPLEAKYLSRAVISAPGSYVSPVDFHRTRTGSWIAADSDLDEPSYLSFDSTLNPDGTSTFLIKYEELTNVEGSLDARASAHMVIKWPHSAKTEDEMKYVVERLIGIICNGDTLSRVLRGE